MIILSSQDSPGRCCISAVYIELISHTLLLPSATSSMQFESGVMRYALRHAGTRILCVCVFQMVLYEDKPVPQHLSPLKAGYLFLTPHCKKGTSSIPECTAHYNSHSL